MAGKGKPLSANFGRFERNPWPNQESGKEISTI
jgi:hypothetical protein